MIFLAGLVDDVRGLGPVPKLAIEFLAAGVVMSSGLLIERITILGATWALGWLAFPITAAWLVGLTNAFNLIDGVDGLAAGIAALAGAACGAILIVRGHAAEAMLLAHSSARCSAFWSTTSSRRRSFSAIAAALSPGFCWPRPAIAGWQKGATALASAVPLLIFALPIGDAASTCCAARWRVPPIGRSIRGVLRDIAQPDREHIHHRLLALGWSVRRTVIILYGVTALFSILALVTARVDGRERRRVLLVQPSLQPSGGANGVAAWMLRRWCRSIA